MQTDPPQRLKREREHFDSLAFHSDIYFDSGAEDYLAHPCIPEHESLIEKFPNGFSGLRVLDIGCGVGEAALSFAARGAIVTGVDVSPIAIGRAKDVAASLKLKIDYQLVSDYKLPFADESFDLIYGNGVLHHLDLSQSSGEIHRVLKPEGWCFFIEPKEGNPLISIYRRLATKQRSPDENPIGETELGFLRKSFSFIQRVPYQLTTLGVFLKIFAWDFRSPNSISYWREPISKKDRYKSYYQWAITVDRKLRRYFPSLFHTLCWNEAISMKK